MLRRLFLLFSLVACLFLAAGCHHAKVQNPIANISSKQPDKELFDKALDSMKHGKFQESRTLLDTLLQTYPDSEYVARAKLAKGDAWYAEGGTAGLQQAEVEYKDFITFFPNMPEAAEAQYKVANIHYKQMEKPDRDFNQAMRAADEYKAMIEQFPDSKLIPEAKQRLREVQEVLAERQWRIAHFYFLRNNLAASEARLVSLTDSYPLYSGADEALFLMGAIYEKEAAAVRLQRRLSEVTKAQLAKEYDDKAIAAYSKIITRYPIMDRAEDARARLKEMKAPVPEPTAEAIAQNQAEQDGRGDLTRMQELIGNFKRHPNVAMASNIGEPNMQEEEIKSAPEEIQHLNATLLESANHAGIETVKAGSGAAPGANAPAPSSETSGSTSGSANGGDAAPSQPQPAAAQPVTATATASAAPAAPAQLNQIGAATDGSGQGAAQSAPAAGTAQPAQASQQQNNSDDQDSSSKKKKKKGLRKIIPF